MSNISKTSLPVNVVKGLDSKIMKEDYREGYIYFATDTKKIYLDTRDARLSMGGNTSIYYADAKFESTEEEEYFFSILDIEDESVPNVKDLILNSDGSFYKVEEIDLKEQTVKAIKLTIQGSGAGPGGNVFGKINLDLISPQHLSYNTILAGRPLDLIFDFSAVDETSTSTGSGRYEIIVDGVVKKKGEAKEGRNTISIGDLFNIVGDYTVQLKCYGDTGGSTESSKTKKFNITSSLFTLNWNYDDKTTINYLSKDFVMNWSTSVESTDVDYYITIDDKYELPKVSNKEQLIITSEELEGLNIQHGAHKFELYASALIGDSTERVDSDHIVKNIMFYDDMSAGDPGFIINCPFFETNVTQFDTIQIPVIIYHPSNNGNATIQFKVNGQNKTPKENCKNFTEYTFAYTPEGSGFIQLQFSCGTTEIGLILEVEALDLDIAEVPGYEFKFKATDFANDTEIQNWTCKGQKILFSDNFDWINGGLKSGVDDVGPYFRIQAGSYMDIPYQIFSDDLKDSGACFKVIFKAYNCRDYDASVIECMNDDRGISLKAQGCEIKSLSKSLTAKYCEDSYIEYEFDVCKYSNKVEDQYLTIWLDGVPAGVTQIPSADSFKQGSAQYLRVGSDDCDVFIYLIKFYKKHLTTAQHLDNFIMDAPNAAEMMRRFNRNNITIKDGNNNTYISPQLLAEKNPDCNVYIYEIPHIPTSKDDVHYGDGNAECCNFTHLKGSREAIRSYEGVKLRAQGTSSMTYGISAYNLDAKFPEKWSLDEEAIPVNYFNTKVNVASCEGANNALNQEWYNRYQPYKTQKRLKNRNDNKIARDTMEFKNGVVFIQDNNKTINSNTATANNIFKEIPGYVNNPYPRMYSIGNMGNSKKNTDVFHGAGNIYECCVEVADNNTDGQRMVTIGGFYPEDKERGVEEHEVGIVLSDDIFDEKGYVKPNVDWGKTYDPVLADNPNFTEEECWLDNKTLWTNSLIGEGLFEFRYCVDEDDFEASSDFSSFEDYQQELSNRFLRLVRWFAKWNPSQATNEPLPQTEIIPAYKVKGVKATAYSNYNVEDEVLTGVTIAGGTFDKDTSEYRVLKMLQESEDYLILDSILYHYLFIERHTMVDNVAKNTFWNTEDGIHWELTKDYDNDTADGVNNSGNLVFDYGTEVMDNAANGTSIFNARPSAWLHFAHGLRPLREKMYQVLETKNAWAAEPYLAAFEEWQSAVPEICWIEDFDRKYFRPNNVYGDDSYLTRLANGKKTHQRKQFEIYQDQYMNSQYKTNTGEGSLIQWRSRQPADPSIMNADGKYEIKAKVKMYADGYFTGCIASGSGSPESVNLHIRGKKGEEIEFSKAQASAFDDATCYVYSPNLYQEFTDTEGLYPEYITAVAANKLRKITFDPKNDIQKRMLKDSLSFGPNVEEVVFKNCQSVDDSRIDFDLSVCGRLRKLDTTGSNLFTSYTIADGAPLEEFRIEEPTALSLSNLRYLNKQDENGNELFNIAKVDRLRKIEIDNIDYNDVNSKDIIESIYDFNPNINIEYDLQNVKWTFDNTDNISDTNIPLLDYLLTKGNTISKKSKADSLTGSAKITDEAYSGTNVLGLYETYGLKTADDSSYPNLVLDFIDAEENLKLYTVTIKNGNGEVKWTRKYNSFANISNADLVNSAQGAFNPAEAVVKQASTTQVFTFNNQWKYTIEGTEITGIIKGADESVAYLDLAQLKDIDLANIIIEPDYTYSTRYYTIAFYDKDTDELLYSVQAEYNTSFEDVKPSVLPIKDDSKLGLTRTYRLRGYSAAKISNTIINEEFWRVTDNANLYPVHDEVSVYDIDYTKYLDIRTFDNSSEVVLAGLKLDPKDPSKFIYNGGKIVLPANITRIADGAFTANATIKKVFTHADLKELVKIGQNAFYGSNLEYFDFNSCAIQIIADNAFRDTPLKAEDYNNVCRFAQGLIFIGPNAFNGGGSTGKMFKGSDGLTFIIPNTIQTLSYNSIANIGSANNVTIQLGSQGQLVGKINFSVGSNPSVFHSNAGASGTSDIRRIDFYTSIYNESSMIGDKPIAKVLIDNNAYVTVSYIKE